MVQDQGKKVGDYMGLTDATAHTCEEKCDNTNGCQSFTYCKDLFGEFNCHLKDKMLAGSEPASDDRKCFTTYKTCGK